MIESVFHTTACYFQKSL